ncbi:glutenin, high molecular weight subunit DX5-like [Ixodes scapularis]
MQQGNVASPTYSSRLVTMFVGINIISALLVGVKVMVLLAMYAYRESLPREKGERKSEDYSHGDQEKTLSKEQQTEEKPIVQTPEETLQRYKQSDQEHPKGVPKTSPMRQAKDIPKRLSKDQGQERPESLVAGPQRILAGESAKGQAREMPKQPPKQPVQEPLKGAPRRHSGPESRDSPTTHVHDIQIQLLGQPVQEQPKDAPGQRLKMVSRASITEQPKQQPMQPPQVYREQPKKLAQEPDKYIGLLGEQPEAAPKAQLRPQAVQTPEKTLQRFKPLDQEPPKGVSEKSPMRQAKDIHERLSKDQGQERPKSLVTGQQKVMTGDPTKVQIREMPKQPPKQPVQEELKRASRRYSGPESRDSQSIHVHEIQIQLPGQQVQEQTKDVHGAQLKIVSPASGTEQPKQEPMQPPRVSREQPKELVQESGKHLGVPEEQPGAAPKAQPRPQVVQALEKTLQRLKPLDQEPSKGVSEKSPMQQAKDIHERLSKDQGQERPGLLVTGQQKIMAGEPTKVQVREMPQQPPKQPVQEQLKEAPRRYNYLDNWCKNHPKEFLRNCLCDRIYRNDCPTTRDRRCHGKGCQRKDYQRMESLSVECKECQGKGFQDKKLEGKECKNRGYKHKCCQGKE